MRNSKYVLRQATLIAAMVAALGAMSAGDVFAATRSTAIGGPVNRVRVSEAAKLRTGDAIDGMLANTTPMHVTIGLNLRNRAQLDSFIQSNASVLKVSHEPMSSAQFMADHAPTDAQVKAVTDFLEGAGFANIEVAPNHLLIEADGRADIAQAAFQTSFARVRTADGREAYANTEAATIPAALQGTVLTVMGLQDVWRAHTMMRPLAPGPVTNAVTGHNPTEFSSIYGGSGVATAAGVTAGIITQGKITQTITDLNKFTSNNGLATVTTQTVQVGSASNDTSGVGEWDLDSQDIVGMGGGQIGKIIFYNINSLSDSNLISGFNKAVTDNVAKVINVSIGGCEDGTQSGAGAEGDNVFAQAVAQGQTFTISTGDDGADECGDGGTTPSWPANSQYVVAVAGTKLDASTTTWNSEVVWNELSIGEGATGGSESKYEPKPSWQTLWTGTHRGVADVAFDGDPESGAKVIVNGGTQQIGGTSLSAPLFAGLWARVIATKGTSVGFAGPIIYQLPAADFHDVTSGNNHGETATAGYDLASGRGSMILNKAINDIGGTTPPANIPPVANFGVTTSGLTASFTDSSTDSDGTISSRSWNFGDGSTSTSTNPSHTYAAAGSYTVSLTVTDDDGASNTKTASVTVSSGGSGGSTVLQNGVAVTGLSGARNSQLMYTMVVPAGATNLKFVTSGGSGDADLYVKFGSAPTTSSYTCRSWNTGNSETCSISNAQAGTYYVMINGYSAFSGLSLTGSYTAGGGGNPGGTTLTNGVPVTGLAATTGNWTSDYTLVVPSGATNLKFAISGGTGDADMYVRLGATPTTSSYDCRPYLSGNTESCTATAPTPGTYHVSLRAYSTFSGVTLTASYTP